MKRETDAKAARIGAELEVKAFVLDCLRALWHRHVHSSRSLNPSYGAFVPQELELRRAAAAARAATAASLAEHTLAKASSAEEVAAEVAETDEEVAAADRDAAMAGSDADASTTRYRQVRIYNKRLNASTTIVNSYFYFIGTITTLRN